MKGVYLVLTIDLSSFLNISKERLKLVLLDSSYTIISMNITNCHYRNRALCRAPMAHGKGRKTHGTAFAVRIFPKRTAKGVRLIFTR
jgi:hypothetical protein